MNEGARVPNRADLNADFPLRGFVLCADCGHPLTACWSTSKTGAKHPYYWCFQKGCESYRKSIRRDKLEGEFETLLVGIQPARRVFDLATAMFRDAWNQHRERAASVKAAIRQGIDKADKQIAQFLDRIVDASTPSVIAAYEKRIAYLEQEKLVLTEKLETGTGPRRPFDEVFELALGFLSNPCNLWHSGHLADRRCALNLVLSERVPYCRNEGSRTPKTSIIFKALEEIGTGNFRLADREGVESIRSFNGLGWPTPIIPGIDS